MNETMKPLSKRIRSLSSVLVPYPLRAMRLELAFHPFTILGGNWFDYTNHSKILSETAKKDGRTIWWIRVGPFTLSYGRMI